MRIWALLALAACGRSEPSSIFEIEAVTTDALPSANTRQLNVSVLLTNSGDTPLTLARITILTEPEDGVRAVADPRNPTVLSANSELSLAFTLTLPPAWTGLFVDAEAVAVDEAAGRVLTARGARAPLRLSAPGPSALNTDLVVTVSGDELDGGATVATVGAAGGAADLSLREAVTIANNRAGADLIAFDPGAFPATAPELITLDVTTELLEITDEATTIDGTGSGIAITVSGGDGPALVGRGHRFTLRGVEIRDCCRGIRVIDAGEAVIEDCEFSTPSPSVCITTDERNLTLNNATAPLVANNQFTSHDNCVTIDHTTGAWLTGNHCSASTVGIYHSDSDNCVIEDNDFSTSSWTWYVHQSQDNQFLSNRIARAGGGCINLHDVTDGTLIEDNLLHDCGDSGGEYAIRVTDGGRFNTFSRNNVKNGQAAFFVEAGAQEDVRAPVIATVVTTAVAGTSTAPQSSVVEVFHDSSFRAEVFVGSTTVGSAGDWTVTLAESIPSGRNVTATATTPNGSTSELATHVPAP